MTHRAMASSISLLGGVLEYIEIDRYIPLHQTYEAKLYMRQMNSDLRLDVRPSDAIVLAVICEVPILVSKDVLAVLHE
jgi:bifunctional DNase/RNase